MAAYGTELGMDEETALRIAAPFGGGMGKTGGTCGAVTAAMMILGLRYGTSDATDKQTREKVYELAAGFISAFISRNGSVACRELLGFDIGSEKDPKKHAIIKERCPGFITDSAGIIEKLLRS